MTLLSLVVLIRTWKTPSVHNKIEGQSVEWEDEREGR